MSKFSVGEVVVIVDGSSWINRNGNLKYIGCEATVLALPGHGDPYCVDPNGYSVEVHGFPGERFFPTENLMRKRRPKDDAEPRSDFTPCDEDFSEWMKKLGRVGA
jgi:hypothetical protein